MALLFLLVYAGAIAVLVLFVVMMLDVCKSKTLFLYRYIFILCLFDPKKRAVLMGTKSCTKILNFSTRFSCENLAIEDFVTLLMGKKSC